MCLSIPSWVCQKLWLILASWMLTPPSYSRFNLIGSLRSIRVQSKYPTTGDQFAVCQIRDSHSQRMFCVIIAVHDSGAPTQVLAHILQIHWSTELHSHLPTVLFRGEWQEQCLPAQHTHIIFPLLSLYLCVWMCVFIPGDTLGTIHLFFQTA